MQSCAREMHSDALRKSALLVYRSTLQKDTGNLSFSRNWCILGVLFHCGNRDLDPNLAAPPDAALEHNLTAHHLRPFLDGGQSQPSTPLSRDLDFLDVEAAAVIFNSRHDGRILKVKDHLNVTGVSVGLYVRQ